MKINLPKKYALMPIFDCDKIIGELVVKNIRVVGYAVSKCYVLEENIKYNEDGTLKKNYLVEFPFKEIFVNSKFDFVQNLVDGEPTITPVDEVFEDYMSAKEVCDIKNKEVFEAEFNKKKEKDRYKFEKNFNKKTDYVARNSVNKLVLERK